MAIIRTPESFASYNQISEDREYVIDDLNITFHNNSSNTIPSYVIKIENDSFKIVYTSDAGNTNIYGLVDFCRDSDLLICEISFVKSHNVNSSTHLHAFDAGTIASFAIVPEIGSYTSMAKDTSKVCLEEAIVIFRNTIIAEKGKQLILAK